MASVLTYMTTRNSARKQVGYRLLRRTRISRHATFAWCACSGRARIAICSVPDMHVRVLTRYLLRPCCYTIHRMFQCLRSFKCACIRTRVHLHVVASTQVLSYISPQYSKPANTSTKALPQYLRQCGLLVWVAASGSAAVWRSRCAEGALQVRSTDGCTGILCIG